jgi:hypothetical protein
VESILMHPNGYAGWMVLAQMSRNAALGQAAESGDIVPGGDVWTGVEADYDPTTGTLRKPDHEATDQGIDRARAAMRFLRGTGRSPVTVEDTFRAYEIVNDADLIESFRAGALTVPDAVRGEVERLLKEGES